MYLLIIFLPFFSFLILSCVGSSLNKKHLIYINLFCIFFCFFLSLFIFYEVIYSGYVCNITLWNWISVGSFRLTFSFLFDYLTGVMLIVVFLVSSLVHLYSVDYMHNDPFLIRFLAYLSLFTFFMILLITAGNFVQFFFGWEGVGLSSYLLINFWYTRIQANKAAIKAIIVNRFGDFGLYFSICFIFLLFGTFDFNFIFTLNILDFYIDNFNIIDIIVLLLLLASIGKSAQIGLHTWLADAMEGPTPVSALIHAATMVTAGIVLLIRASYLLEQSLLGLVLISSVGALTIFFAGTVGMYQNDIKKIIAFSTCSQLGYMLFACGFSAYNVSLFHLFNHAFFKALLFLGAGSIIHAVLDEQDIRKMGALTRLLPVTYISMIIGSVSLMGLPFLSGFYSKDLILELANFSFQVNGYFLYLLATISVFFTAFYSIRLLYYVFFGDANWSLYLKNTRIYEANNSVLFVLSVLSLLSIGSGYIFKELFAGPGISFIFSSSYNVFDAEFGVPLWIKFIPLFCTILGSALAMHILIHFLSISYILNYNFFVSILFGKRFLFLYRFFNQQWYFNYIYNQYIVKWVLNFGYNISLKLVDRGFLEYFGPFGIVNLVKTYSLKFSRFQTGYIFNYIVIIIVSVFILLNILFFHTYYLQQAFLLFGLVSFLSINEQKDINIIKGNILVYLYNQFISRKFIYIMIVTFCILFCYSPINLIVPYFVRICFFSAYIFFLSFGWIFGFYINYSQLKELFITWNVLFYINFFFILIKKLTILGLFGFILFYLVMLIGFLNIIYLIYLYYYKEEEEK